MTMPYGLLEQSAVARMLAAKQGANQTPQAPNLGGLMAPPIPAPVPFNPNAGGMPDDPSAHVEGTGLLGKVRHALGADRIAPELGALLTPEQRERVKPGLLATVGNALLTGRGPQSVQQARAMNLLALQDAKKARDKVARDEKLWGNIQQVAAAIPDPQARLEYVARTASAYGLPQAEEAAMAADRLRPPQMQARANAKLTVLGSDGNYYAIQQDASGAEVPGSRVRVPKPTAGITYKEGKGPDGAPVYYAMPSEESGDQRGPIAPRNTGVVVPETGADTRAATAAAEARANKARLMTDDLAGVDEALAQLERNPSAFGLKNVLPSVIRNRLPGADEDAVAIGSLEYVMGRLRHDRFGAALTQGEAERAMRIFSEPSSPPDVIRAQLEVIRKALLRQQQTLQDQQASAPPAASVSRETSVSSPPSGGKTVTVNGKTFRIP